MAVHRLIFILWLALTAAACLGQQPDTPTPTLRTRTTLVQVPVLVTAKTGVVYTLTVDDFIVTDDGSPQKLSLDENTGQPLALVVVVETGGAGGRQLDKYRELGPMIENLVGGVKHKVAVVEFDSQPNLLLSFTPDLDHVSRIIEKLEEADAGAAIYDGLSMAVDLLRKESPEYRRAILLISETVDHGSKLKTEDVLRVITETNTAIYSLGSSSTTAALKKEAANMVNDPNPGPPGGCMAADPNEDPAAHRNKAEQAFDCAGLLLPPLRLIKMAAIGTGNALRKNVPETVAQISGGEYFRTNSEKGLQTDLLTLSNHLSNRYLLSFQPVAPHGGLHLLGVELKNYNGLRIDARKQYWVDEPK